MMDTSKALRIAFDRGLDLVEINPNSSPSICKLMDYGKFKYQISKKQHKAKKKQKLVITKELKLGPRIDVHDFNLRLNRGKKFLDDGYRVKYSIQYRGREINLKYLGDKLFNNLLEELKDLSDVESYPDKRSNTQALILVPKKKVSQTT